MKMIKNAGCCLFMAIACLSGQCLSGKAKAAGLSSSQIESPTHRQIRVLRPKVDGQPVTLHTMTTDADGNLLIAVDDQTTQSQMAQSVPAQLSGEPAKKLGYVLRIDAEGNELDRWTCGLTPSALAVAPDGTIFVGGSGKIAKLDAEGACTKPIDSPHIGDRKSFAKRTIRAQQRLMRTFMTEESLQPIRDMVQKLKDKPEEERSRVEVAQLKALEMQLEQMEKLVGNNQDDEEGDDDFQVDPMMEMQVEYAMKVTSMAASQSKLFVCATDPSNGGYSVWSLDHDLNPENTEVILSDLRGCCGQMDIQCCDEKLIVSENSSFQIGVYDLDGQRVTSFGSMDRTSQNGFGSCCNPMNSLPLADGTVLTAESSIGHIKHFDLDGNLIAYVGKANIGGGCKHCAMGYDATNDLYFMMYQDKNGICVLGDSEKYPLTEAERMVTQRQSEFAKTYAGTWAKEGTKTQQRGFFGSLFGGETASQNDSTYPVTSWTIEADGSVQLNAGQYASFMTDAKLELLPSEEGDDQSLYRVAIADNQVRMIEMSLRIDGSQMNVEFSPGMAVTLSKVGSDSETEAIVQYESMLAQASEKQTCDPSCDGTKCGNQACAKAAALVSETQTSDTLEPDEPKEIDVLFDEIFSVPPPKKKRVVAALIMPAQRIIKPAQRIIEQPKVATYDRSVSTPRFEYKLLSAKELGEHPEAGLNKLGANGWDFCGKLGKKLMFKRVAVDRKVGAQPS